MASSMILVRATSHQPLRFVHGTPATMARPWLHASKSAGVASQELVGLESGNTTGRSTAHAVEASFAGFKQPIPDRTVRSERVLPVLIADATHGGDTQQRYDDAVAWRAEGGSWWLRLALARTGAWLDDLGRLPDGVPSARMPADDELGDLLAEVDSGFGRVRHLRVPGDLSIAGFDDIARLMRAGLFVSTAMRLPAASSRSSESLTPG